MQPKTENDGSFHIIRVTGASDRDIQCGEITDV